MAYAAIRSPMKHGLDCYMLAIRPSHLVGFLGHDPRSKHWKTLPSWLLTIYQEKQRSTAKSRIDALSTYIRGQLMHEHKIGALPPISIIQFEPFKEEQLQDLGHGAVLIDLDEFDATRVLIDGLARVTAIQEEREVLQSENPTAYEKLNAFRFSVGLYVPTQYTLGKIDAGQLFHDFNSYAWPVPSAMALAADNYNLYKQIAVEIADDDLLRRHGGLKSGSSNLGKKDTAFTTELAMSQFVKIAVEGQRGYGKLTKPLTNPRIAEVDPHITAQNIMHFLTAFETAIGIERFKERTQLFRTAHGFYAIAVIVNDVTERRTSLQNAVAGLAAIDWTWSNPQFRLGIGRKVDDTAWKLNTGAATFDWLVKYCRTACNVIVSEAA